MILNWPFPWIPWIAELGGTLQALRAGDLPSSEALGNLCIPREAMNRKYTNEASRFMDLAGARIHYRDEGTGPVLLLLHGICNSLHTWDVWVQVLKSRFRIVRLDMPGFGLTGPVDRMAYSREGTVDAVLRFVDRLGLGSFSIAGNSLGGFVAWNLALRQPARVQKMILLDPVGYNQPLPWILELASTPFLRPLVSAMMPRVFFDTAIAQAYGDPSRATLRIRQRYFEMAMTEGNREAYLDLFAAMRALNRSADLSRGIRDIRVPTLVMWGLKDQWIPHRFLYRWKRDLPSARYISYPGVGHMPMEEIPGPTALDALRFLNG